MRATVWNWVWTAVVALALLTGCRRKPSPWELQTLQPPASPEELAAETRRAEAELDWRMPRLGEDRQQRFKASDWAWNTLQRCQWLNARSLEVMKQSVNRSNVIRVEVLQRLYDREQRIYRRLDEELDAHLKEVVRSGQ